MTIAPNAAPMANTDSDRLQGQVLKGWYVGCWRSKKGKLKGLFLQAGSEEYTVKLPKYLRPMLLFELVPETAIQVWAYPDADIWRAINILPLPESEVLTLPPLIDAGQRQPSPPAPVKSNVCIQVCRKGKCFKRGSRAIWQLLNDTVAHNPDLQHIEIEATGCMKACEKGPNLKVLPQGKLVNRVNETVALSVLSQYQS